MTHYTIKDASGRPASLNLLKRHFGRIWRSSLDRLPHDYDGYIMAIWLQREQYKIYRELSESTEAAPD